MNSLIRSGNSPSLSLCIPSFKDCKRYNHSEIDQIINEFVLQKKLPKNAPSIVGKLKAGSPKEIISIQEGIDRCISIGISQTELFKILVEADQGRIRTLFESAFDRNDIEKAQLLFPYLKGGAQAIESLIKKKLGKNISDEILKVFLPICSSQLKRLFRNQLIIQKRGVEVYSFSKEYSVPADLNDFKLSQDFFSHIPTTVALIRWMKEEGSWIPFLERTEKGSSIVLKATHTFEEETISPSIDWISFERELEEEIKKLGRVEIIAREQHKDYSLSLITIPKNEEECSSTLFASLANEMCEQSEEMWVDSVETMEGAQSLENSHSSYIHQNKETLLTKKCPIRESVRKMREIFCRIEFLPFLAGFGLFSFAALKTYSKMPEEIQNNFNTFHEKILIENQDNSSIMNFVSQQIFSSLKKGSYRPVPKIFVEKTIQITSTKERVRIFILTIWEVFLQFVRTFVTEVINPVFDSFHKNFIRRSSFNQ